MKIEDKLLANTIIYIRVNLSRPKFIYDKVYVKKFINNPKSKRYTPSDISFAFQFLMNLDTAGCTNIKLTKQNSTQLSPFTAFEETLLRHPGEN